MVNEPCCYPLNLREVWQSFRLNILFFFIMWVNFYCYQILSNYIIKQKLQYQAKCKIVFQTMRKKLSVAITHLIAITTETLQHFQFCFDWTSHDILSYFNMALCMLWVLNNSTIFQFYCTQRHCGHLWNWWPLLLKLSFHNSFL